MPGSSNGEGLRPEDRKDSTDSRLYGSFAEVDDVESPEETTTATTASSSNASRQPFLASLSGPGRESMDEYEHDKDCGPLSRLLSRPWLLRRPWMWSTRCGMRWPDHCCLWCLLFALPLALVLGCCAALYLPGLISGLAARKMASQQLMTRDSPNLAHFINSSVSSKAYRHFCRLQQGVVGGGGRGRRLGKGWVSQPTHTTPYRHRRL